MLLAALAHLGRRAVAAMPAAAPAAAPAADRHADLIDDLAVPVDPHHDRIRGPGDAPVTLVEYGDFECPYCGQAEPIVRELLRARRSRYVWRHLPLNDVHPNAQVAAEAAEAAAEQDAFWDKHDLLFDHQDGLADAPRRLRRELGLDVDRFRGELRRTAGRVARDVESADLSASPARRPSSSTARATTVPTTSTL